MAILYVVTNLINGKQYIGATITQLNERWNRHLCDAKHNRGNQALHAAIRKYGPENFKIEQILEHQDEKYLFEVLEPEYIQKYKTYGNDGYNMTLGGDGWNGMKHTEESKEKISKANKGKVRTSEMIQKMSEIRKGKPTWNKGLTCPKLGDYRRGKPYSEESKQIFSEAHKGLKHSDETKNKIKTKNSENHTVLDISSGEIIEIENLYQFCKNNKISQGNLVALGCTKGFKLLKTIKTIRTYTIQNIETKEIYTTENLKKFCDSINISNAGLLSKYKINKSYMNWKILDIKYTQKEKTYK